MKWEYAFIFLTIVILLCWFLYQEKNEVEESVDEYENVVDVTHNNERNLILNERWRDEFFTKEDFPSRNRDHDVKYFLERQHRTREKYQSKKYYSESSEEDNVIQPKKYDSKENNTKQQHKKQNNKEYDSKPHKKYDSEEYKTEIHEEDETEKETSSDSEEDKTETNEESEEEETSEDSDESEKEDSEETSSSEESEQSTEPNGEEDSDESEEKNVTIVSWDSINDSKGERLCAQILSNLTGLSLIKVRIEQIRNPKTGEPLEIDCYNEKARIGLEFQGPQHYHYPNWTECSLKEFKELVGRDEFKRNKCHELGIKLIEVPYTIAQEDLEEYIKEQFVVLGIKLLTS